MGQGLPRRSWYFNSRPRMRANTGDICAKELLPCLNPIHPHPLICPLLENTASRTYARDLNGFSAVNAHTRPVRARTRVGACVALVASSAVNGPHDVPLRAMDAAVQRAVECRHSRSACEGRGGREERSRKFQPTSDKATPRRAGQGRGGRSSPGAGRAAAQATRFASIRSRQMRFSRQYAHGSYSHAIGKRVREQIHMGSSDNIPFVVLHESPLFIVVICGRCINAYLRPVIAR